MSDLLIGSYLTKRGVRRYHLSYDGVRTLCGIRSSARLVFSSAPNTKAAEHPFVQEQGCARCQKAAHT